MRTKPWKLAGILAAGAALFLSTAFAENRDRLRIVTVDDDGHRHEEVFEFDEDHPRPFLGVRLMPAEDGGAVVESVVEGSAAEDAGIEPGDVIVEIDGTAVERPWDLTRGVLKRAPGDRVEIEVVRDGQSRSLSAELGEGGGFAFGKARFHHELGDKLERLHEHLGALEELDELGDMDFHFDFSPGNNFHHGFRSSRPVLGVELVETTPELRGHLGSDPEAGVLVGRVMRGLPAESAGVEVGDLIVAIDDVRIHDAGDLRRALRERVGESFVIEVIRDKASTFLDVALPEPEREGFGKRLRPAGKA